MDATRNHQHFDRLSLEIETVKNMVLSNENQIYGQQKRQSEQDFKIIENGEAIKQAVIHLETVFGERFKSFDQECFHLMDDIAKIGSESQSYQKSMKEFQTQMKSSIEKTIRRIFDQSKLDEERLNEITKVQKVHEKQIQLVKNLSSNVETVSKEFH